MTALDTKLYARIVHNGKTTDLPRDRLERHIVRFIAFSKGVQSRGLSSLRLETSVVEFSRDAGGLSADESAMAALLEGVEVEQTEEDGRWQDPLWIQYQSMHNRRNIERETPEGLARLRKHIESRYPDYYAANGHHF